MKTGYTVADAMSTKPITVPKHLTVRDASKVMAKHGIGSILIMDEHGELCGILTSDDIVHRVTAEARPSSETTLESVMTTDLIAIAPDEDLYEAMQLMKEHDIVHLPVRDADKRLVGYLTLKDVLKIEPTLFELMAEMAEISTGANNRLRGKQAIEGYCENCGNYSTSLLLLKGKKTCSFCADGE